MVQLVQYVEDGRCRRVEAEERRDVPCKRCFSSVEVDIESRDEGVVLGAGSKFVEILLLIIFDDAMVIDNKLSLLGGADY